MECRVLGVMKMLDGGEEDDKIIAVSTGVIIYSFNYLYSFSYIYIKLGYIIQRCHQIRRITPLHHVWYQKIFRRL